MDSEIEKDIKRFLELKASEKEIKRELKELTDIIVDNEYLVKDAMGVKVVRSTQAKVKDELFEEVDENVIKMFARQEWKVDITLFRRLVKNQPEMEKYLEVKDKAPFVKVL